MENVFVEEMLDKRTNTRYDDAEHVKIPTNGMTHFTQRT